MVGNWQIQKILGLAMKEIRCLLPGFHKVTMTEPCPGVRCDHAAEGARRDAPAALGIPRAVQRRGRRILQRSPPDGRPVDEPFPRLRDR